MWLRNWNSKQTSKNVRIFFCIQNSNLEFISAVASHVFLWFSWIFWILIHLKCWVIPEIPQHQLGQYKLGLYSAFALELIVECRANPTVSLNMHRNPSVLEVKPYDSVHEVRFWLCQRVHVKWKQVTKFKEHLVLLDIQEALNKCYFFNSSAKKIFLKIILYRNEGK